MASNFRLADKAGASRAALRAPGVAAAVDAAAERIASRARSLTDDDVVVKPHERRDRHGAYVTRLGSGARGEAEDRALGRSIGGGA
jgi:hypothetical protein